MNPELARVRGRIDALDKRLAALLARRFALAAGLARRKLKARIADPARERRVLANAAAAAGPDFSRPVRSVFMEIIKQSRALQARIK